MKLTNRRCQCAGCGKYFNSVHAFEKHRAGIHKDDTRRCMTADEMERKGMFFVQRDDGQLWYGSKWKESAETAENTSRTR